VRRQRGSLHAQLCLRTVPWPRDDVGTCSGPEAWKKGTSQALSHSEHLPRNNQGTGFTHLAQTRSFVLSRLGCRRAKLKRVCGARVLLETYTDQVLEVSTSYRYSTYSPRHPAPSPFQSQLPSSYISLPSVHLSIDEQLHIVRRARQTTAQHDDLCLLSVSCSRTHLEIRVFLSNPQS
jgi:hypothetical protein